MTEPKTTLSYLVEDYGDPEVGLFGTTYNVTITLDGGLDEDTIKYINDTMKDILPAVYDSGTRINVLTQDELTEREKEYEEMAQWEQEQLYQQEQYEQYLKEGLNGK